MQILHNTVTLNYKQKKSASINNKSKSHPFLSAAHDQISQCEWSQ